MGFSCPSLAVSQYSCIVSFQYRLNSRFRSIGVYKFLSTILIVNVVKAVALPNTQMRTLLDVTCALSFLNLLAQILHDSNRSVIRGNFNNWHEGSVGLFTR